MPQSVRDAAAKFLPASTKLESQDDIIDLLFSYDVLGTAKAALAEFEAESNGPSNGVVNSWSTEPSSVTA
jgi:salicylate hydroxylase